MVQESRLVEFEVKFPGWTDIAGELFAFSIENAISAASRKRTRAGDGFAIV